MRNLRLVAAGSRNPAIRDVTTSQIKCQTQKQISHGQETSSLPIPPRAKSSLGATAQGAKVGTFFRRLRVESLPSLSPEGLLS